MSFYAVARGFKVGIYETWETCERQVKGFKGAKYKKFRNRKDAEDFIQSINASARSSSITSSSTRYEPRDCAVSLAKTDNTKIVQQPATDKGETDFWPESDGDSFEDNTLSDTDLLTAISEIEGESVPVVRNNTTQKRAFKWATALNSSAKRAKRNSKIWEAAGVKMVGPFEFQIDSEGYVIVYTDGSCINNGGENACAGFGVYFDDFHPLNAAKPVVGRVTNNVGEIQAAIHAIKVAKHWGIPKLCINTDSQFLINAITCWINSWKRKNWRLANGEPVKNVVDFKELDELLQDNLDVKWNYVKAHKGIKGNEMADKLAREGSAIYKSQHLKQT